MQLTRWLAAVSALGFGTACETSSNAENDATSTPFRESGPKESGGSSGTDGSPSGPASGSLATVHVIELYHLSEKRAAWSETRTLVSALSLQEAWETVDVDPNEVVVTALRSADGQILDAQFLSPQCEPKLELEPLTLTVPTDYQTIQAALDASRPLDTVRVLPGTYHEHLRLPGGVRLIGAGATETILDGDGVGENLIDFSTAHDVVVSGFTLRNVGQRVGCGSPDDPLACSGNWYASGVYADGHSVVDDDEPCNDPSIYLSDNVVTGNDIGMMLYFLPYAVVRNNVFVGNRVAFAANHHGGASALLVQNIFYDNTEQAVAVSASFLDILNNVFLENEGTVLHQEFCQRGRLRCNVLWNNAGLGDREFLASEGNLREDPLFSPVDFSLDANSPIFHTACAGEPEPAPTMSTDGCTASSL